MNSKAQRKRELRRSCFASIRALSIEEKALSSGLICQQIQQLDQFQQAHTVLGYLPLSSEPDLTPLFDREKTWAFSRVLEDDSMEFRIMENLNDSILGDFKIREPDSAKCPEVLPDQIDLIIIPGVGFNADSGDRLGRGKGHYDRYLEKQLSRENPPFLIGVCFQAQLCQLNPEPHDIPMNRVIFG